MNLYGIMPGVEITTNLICKYSCEYCPQKKLSEYDGSRFMSFEDFKKILSNVPYNYEVFFSGFSEPFLNEDCFKMIRHCFKQGYDKIGLYTNLIPCTLDDLKKIVDIPFHEFVVHIPCEGERLAEFIDDDFGEKLKFVVENFNDVLFISIDYLRFEEYPVEIEKVLNSLDRSIARIKYTNRADNLKSVDLKEGFLPYCKRLFQGVVLPNGDLQLCCSDYSLKHKLGNLFFDNLDDIYSSNRFLDILEKHKKGEILCRTCCDNKIYGTYTEQEVLEIIGKR